MKKSKAIALASLAALTLASCNSAPDETVVEPADPAATEAPVASASGEAASEGGEDELRTQVFTSPDGVIVTESDAEPQIAGLIPSTDANLRIKAVGQGRQDPFSGRVVLVRPLPPDPEVIESTNFSVPQGAGVPSTAFVAPSNAEGRGASRGASGAAIATRGGGSGSAGSGTTGSGTAATPRGGGSGSSGVTATRGGASGGSAGAGSTTATRGGASGGSGAASPTQIAAGPSALPDLTPREPAPDPTTARAVEVTGVIQVGSTYQAIVKAPDEPTSRYVSVGQRLSNGRVLVKRIESNGSEPVVILEESGVEVVRAVGASSDGAQETALLPAAPVRG